MGTMEAMITRSGHAMGHEAVRDAGDVDADVDLVCADKPPGYPESTPKNCSTRPFHSREIALCRSSRYAVDELFAVHLLASSKPSTFVAVSIGAMINGRGWCRRVRWHMPVHFQIHCSRINIGGVYQHFRVRDSPVSSVSMHVSESASLHPWMSSLVAVKLAFNIALDCDSRGSQHERHVGQISDQIFM